MNSIESIEIEKRLKNIILSLILEPIQKLHLQEEILKKYWKNQRQTTRKVEELEFIVQKFQRANTYDQKIDRRFDFVEEEIATQNAKYEDQIRQMQMVLKEDIPDQLKGYKDELRLFKRWFTQIQLEFDKLVKS